MAFADALNRSPEYEESTFASEKTRLERLLMNLKTIYLLLTIFGSLGPAYAIAPFLIENGPYPHMVLTAMFSTPAGAFAGWNLLAGCVCLIVLAHTEGKSKGITTWKPIVAMGLFGISSGLPLYLYLREKAEA